MEHFENSIRYTLWYLFMAAFVYALNIVFNDQLHLGQQLVIAALFAFVPFRIAMPSQTPKNAKAINFLGAKLSFRNWKGF